MEVVVHQGYAGLLYEDGAFKRLLSPGRYQLRGFFSLSRARRHVVQVDTRERSIIIKGQEILTADKVAIRVSLLVYFRVRDPEAAIHNVAAYEERIYEDVQLSARRFLASRSLEAILSDRNEISDAVRDEVKGTAAGYGVEILRADVKDLVFPGNLREIMNEVLETERKAEAKLIQARKDAEAARIKLEVENRTARDRLQAEQERLRMTAEAELERARLRQEADALAAQALETHPLLLRVRELETLSQMAQHGAQFVVGLPQAGFGELFRRNERKES
jgi:regulator of protease activity HflC (stomatin/prohibitin superfamily)